MTVEELRVRLGAVYANAADRQNCALNGFYAGDFLSNVMGRVGEGQAWFTVMTNVNVAGVAVLGDVACVVVCEGHVPDELLVERAREKGICLMTTELPVYEACARTA